MPCDTTSRRAPGKNRPVEILLREIGRRQLRGFRGSGRADLRVKRGVDGRRSVVTRHDTESERWVSRHIARHFPGESFLGEEHGNVIRDPDRYWVFDPIDGTTNFTQGIVYWGPTLARFRGGCLEEGWIYFPALDELFHARQGQGATLNGRPIHASRVRTYSDLSTVATTSRFHRRWRLCVPAKHRILGSVVANLAYLATGLFAAVYCRAHVWDLAAGILIAREAGAHLECSPEPASLDLASTDASDAPIIQVFGRANRSLPPLQAYVQPAAPRPRGDR